MLCYRDGRLAAVESVNQPGDHIAARKLLAAGHGPDPAEAEAEGFSLKAFARQAPGPPDARRPSQAPSSYPSITAVPFPQQEKPASEHTSVRSARANQRRVAFATIIGTTVEWYDFFIYATAAGLVFAQVFFAPAGESIGLLLAFASVGISFLFRPLGAFLAGHFGDRIGRRADAGDHPDHDGRRHHADRRAAHLRDRRGRRRPSCCCCCASSRASPPAANGAARC